MIVWGRFARHNPASMQKSPGRSYAFTLIELLVVIAIIAILIGLLFPAFRAVQNQAKQTQAKNDLTQIVNAVNAFYTDYGRYPLVTADTIYGPASTQTMHVVQRVARVRMQLTIHARLFLSVHPMSKMTRQVTDDRV